MLLGLRQVAGLECRVIERQLVVHGLSPQADLEAFEAQGLGEGDGLDVSGFPEVPIGDPESEASELFLGRGEPGCRLDRQGRARCEKRSA